MPTYVVKTIAAAVTVALTGCGTVMHRNEIRDAQTEGKQTVSTRLEQTRNDDRIKSSPVREINGVWLGAKTIKVSRDAELPVVFHQPTAFQFPDDPSLSVIADRISKIAGMTVRVTPDALVPIESLTAKRVGTQGSSQTGAGASVPPLTGQIGAIAPSMMNGGYQPPAVPTRRFIIDMATPFNGTLAELLDKVSAKFAVGWDYKDGSILVSRYVTRTYQLSTIMDTNDLSSGITKTASTGTSGATGGSATSTSDVSTKITAKLEATKGVESAIKDMLTPGVGNYAISSSGLISVTDTREVQEQVRELIESENKVVGRQVKLRVQVVQVEASQNDDMGVDWSWAINNAARKWNVNFAAPSGMPNGSTGFGQLGVIRNGDNSTSSAFLRALSEIGKVNIRRDETYLTLNNRMVSVATTDNFTYPAKSTAATSTTAGSTAVPGVEPGQLTTGTFLNLRASIQPNGSVITQLALDASVRGKTDSIVSNGVTQLFPQWSGNQYQIYASAVSGDTAVVAGIDNTEQRATDRALDGTLTPLLGGGIAASTTRRAVLILLTPVIVEGVN